MSYNIQDAKQNDESKQPLLDDNKNDDEIVNKIREFSNDKEWRRLIYLLLVMLSIVPILAESLDLVGKWNSSAKYKGNQFCDSNNECVLGLAGCVLILVPILVPIICRMFLFMLKKKKLFTCGKEVESFACRIFILLPVAIGIIFLLSAIIVVISGDGNEELVCVEILEGGDKYCRIQYFGTQFLSVMVIVPAWVEFLMMNRWDATTTQYYVMNRQIWFCIGLLVMSVCTCINLLENKKHYKENAMDNISYGMSLVGYISVSLGCICALITRICIASCRQNIIAAASIVLLLLGMVFAEAGETDIVVYTLMCIISASDIYVLKQCDESLCSILYEMIVYYLTNITHTRFFNSFTTS
eukprot:270148_1